MNSFELEGVFVYKLLGVGSEMQKAYLNNEAKLFYKEREFAQHKDFNLLCER